VRVRNEAPAFKLFGALHCDSREYAHCLLSYAMVSRPRVAGAQCLSGVLQCYNATANPTDRSSEKALRKNSQRISTCLHTRTPSAEKAALP
jgi:hypothetical protein